MEKGNGGTTTIIFYQELILRITNYNVVDNFLGFLVQLLDLKRFKCIFALED